MDLDSDATSSHKTRLRRHSNTPKLQHYTFNTPHTPHTRESATDRTPVIQKATPHIHPTTIPSAHFIAPQRGDIFFEIVKGSFGSLAAENINHLNTGASENVPSVSRALEASTSTFVAAWQTSVLVALGPSRRRTPHGARQLRDFDPKLSRVTCMLGQCPRLCSTLVMLTSAQHIIFTTRRSNQRAEKLGCSTLRAPSEVVQTRTRTVHSGQT